MGRVGCTLWGLCWGEWVAPGRVVLPRERGGGPRGVGCGEWGRERPKTLEAVWSRVVVCAGDSCRGPGVQDH